MRGASHGVAMNDAAKNDKEGWTTSGQGNMFFTHFEAENCGTSSGDDEGNCVYKCAGKEIS